jgi:hypothetical protein
MALSIAAALLGTHCDEAEQHLVALGDKLVD